MAFFGRKLLTKSHLQRAAVAFGGVQSAQPKSDAYRIAASIEIQKYENSDGGMWNYEDLLLGIREVARGASADQLKRRLEGLTGSGEADAKLSLLSTLLERTPLPGSESVQVGAREVDLGNDVFLLLEYDLSVKKDGIVYCYFIYPKVTPIKQKVRDAIISEYRTPFAGMGCPHKLVYIENPKVGKKRIADVEILDFEFVGCNENFRSFLRTFADQLQL
jgi:hypothetical protein